MFKPILDFFGTWYEMSAQELLAIGFGIFMVSVVIIAAGSVFFALLNG